MRLQRSDVPGVILGDEVGKGKTYIALALAFAVLTTNPRARVLVLTHSRSMAKTWADRWEGAVRKMVPPRWQPNFDGRWKARLAGQYTEFTEILEETAGKSAILFASYDTLKRFRSHEGRRRHLLGALSFVFKAHGLRLSRKEKLHLVKAIVPDGGTMPRLADAVDKAVAIKMLRQAFDPKTRHWCRNARQLIDDFLDSQAAAELKIRPKIDLLIVDEAHKLEGERRGAVVTHLLDGKFRKGVWVTATPFALTLAELRRRLRQFEHAASAPGAYRSAIDDLPLIPYQRAVSDRVEFPQLNELQTALRRRMVRSTWDNAKQRKIIDWTAQPSGAALLPSMVLERVISNVINAGDRTHIASVRETLCSSWAATFASLTDGALARFRGDPWTSKLKAALNGTVMLDPKLRTAVDQLVRLAEAGEKTVVFTHRIETSDALSTALQNDPRIRALTAKLRKASKRWRERATRVQQALNIPKLQEAYTVAKLIASSLDAPESAAPRAIRAWWRRHEKSFNAQAQSAKGTAFSYLDAVAGRARRLPVVVRYDSYVFGGDESELDSVGNDRKFNLPGAPLILIATRKGQEAIDLHHYCRRVVLYDLPWNPALIEQRIGRVHRMGGLRSKTRPVEVIYCYQKGGYEDLIAQRVKRRCEMMHALLGAGTWLDQDREVESLSRYRMTFPA